jgi:hypothetical protein
MPPHQRIASAIKHGYARNYSFFNKIAFAAPQILMLTTWLAYIITTTTLCSTGLQLMSVNLSTDIETAQLGLQSQRNLLYTQQLLHEQTEELLNTQLSWAIWETYEDCLARGLGQVDRKLFGIGFQYADIRNQTIDWTVDNCKRLKYTPQVVNPNGRRAFWARGTLRLRCITERTLGFISHRVTSLWTWWSANTHPPSPEETVQPLAQSQSGSNDSARSSQITTEVKIYDGFALQCANTSPCQLMYLHASVPLSNEALISERTVKKNAQKIKRLTALLAFVNRPRYFITLMIISLISLELLLLAIYATFATFGMNTRKGPKQIFAINHKSPVSNFRRFVDRFTQEQQYAIAFITTELLVHLIRGALNEEIANGRNFHNSITAFVVMLSITALTNLFVPLKTFEKAFMVRKRIYALYDIATRSEPPLVEVLAPDEEEEEEVVHEVLILDAEQDPGEQHAVDETEPLATHETTTGVPTLSYSTSDKVFGKAYQVPPATNLQGSIYNELHTMREAQDQGLGETDNATESDGEAYGDLPGYISPTFTDESDWAVVDA